MTQASSENKSESSAITAELQLEREIDKRLDEIVELVEKQIQKSGVIGNLQPSQLRNAASVAANTATSFQTVKNWIRYQVGRSNSRWPEKFADGVIKDCEELRKKADEIANFVPAFEVANIHIRLIRLYLGYLIRAFIYQDKMRPQQDTQREARR